METQAKVTKIRALIADARTMRGLPPAQPINGLETALQRAKELRVRHTLEPPTAPYPIRRKHLLARIRYSARSYGLYAHVDDFVDGCAATNLNGLDVDALDALESWLSHMIEAMQTSSDWSDAPPAR